MGPTVVSSGSPDVMVLAVAKAAAFGSRASDESNFRELDDVFLQTQTRIWLGEVLQTRLHEQGNISDLLVDGELLFEVSKVIWKMLLTKKMELRHQEANKYEPFVSRKSGGRYMPYSNVASFLKICKIMGLSGIDLFSPSDVVEKRNTKKVCMCIRSLSKKARVNHLYIPDFDIVTYTVAMPTDMVGYIRRSIESSQRCPISSGSQSSSGGSRSRSRQKRSVSTPARNYHSYSDESDEAESGITFFNSCSSSVSPFTSFEMKSDLDNLLEVSSDLNSYNRGKTPFQLDSNKLESFRITLDQFEGSWSTESVGSIYSQHDQPDIISNSFWKVPEIHINSEANLKIKDMRSHGNSAFDTYVGTNMKNQVSIASGVADGKILKRCESAPLLVASDMDFHCTGGFLDKGGGTYIASSGVCSHGICQSAVDDKFQSDTEFVEVSSYSSKNSASLMVFNCGFDDLFNVEDDIRNHESKMLNQKDIDSVDSKMFKKKTCDSQNSKLRNQRHSHLYEKDIISYSSQEKNEFLFEDITIDTDETEFETRVQERNVDTSSRNNDFICSCDSEDCMAPVLLHDVHYGSKFLETESSKNNNPDLDSSMLIKSVSSLDFQIQDQIYEYRSKESSDNRYSVGSIRKDTATVQSQGIESFAGHLEELSASHIESVSEIVQDLDSCYQTCSSSGGIGYHDSYSVPRTVDRKDLEAPNISGVCSGPQEIEVIPVISSKDVYPQTASKSSLVKSTAEEHVSSAFGNITKSNNQDCRNAEVVNKCPVESSGEVQHQNLTAPEHKFHGKALLKNLLKGTAVVGALIFLVQMRRSIIEGTGEPKTQSKQGQKVNKGKSPSHVRQQVCKIGGGLYPAEKLKF